jgi:hypothetical protein
MQYLRPQRSLNSPGVRNGLQRVSKPSAPTTGTPSVGIPCFRPIIGEEEIAAAIAVLRSGWLTTGPKAREFEQKFAAFLGGDPSKPITTGEAQQGRV